MPHDEPIVPAAADILEQLSGRRVMFLHLEGEIAVFLLWILPLLTLLVLILERQMFIPTAEDIRGWFSRMRKMV